MINLKLEDLKPAEASFTLSDRPGKTYVLRKFSLAERIWINNRFGKEKISAIFETQSLPEMAEIAHHLLKDGSEFPTFLDFAKAIVSIPDQISLTKALLSTIGIDDALIKTLSDELDRKGPKDPNAQAPIP